MNTFLLATVSVATSVAAQFLLKAGMSSASVQKALATPSPWDTVLSVLSDRLVLTGFVLYGLGAVVWLGVLARWDVSKAYPLVGLGFVLTLAVGMLQGESVSGARAVGVTLICAGVFLVGKS